MRNALKRLFADGGKIPTASKPDCTQATIYQKPEVLPALYGEQYSGRPQRYNSNRGRGRGNRRGNNYNRGGGAGRGRPGASFVCGSMDHWAPECPRGRDGEYFIEDASANEGEEVHVTLMATATDFDDRASVLMGEALGSIVLDSGCSRTVCGEQWLDCFLETLSDKEKASIKYYSSNSVFRFGDDRKMSSIQCCGFPCVLGGKSIRIKTDVVRCNIPLLLSKSSMKKADMIINMKTDTVSVFGKVIKLNTTTLGHYVLPVYRCPTPEVINEVLTASDVADCGKTAMKLHRQFAHPSSEKLCKLVRDAGRKDKRLLEAIENVTENCDTCRRFRKVRPRPVVSMPMASKFNETLAMDLKVLRGKVLLVMVDMCTRYCAAKVIPNKNASTVAEALFTTWIAYFGAPHQILSDNGGEFNNEVMRTMGDFFDVKLLYTAAESPWSNGTCERLNCILSVSMLRVMDDLRCPVETALAWSVAARNTLHNFSGYAPAQLVFGCNPSFPSLCDAKPPALEDFDASHIVAQNLNAMHTARKEFLKCEYDDRIRRALLHQVREDDVKSVSNGDSVYFKRQDNKWHGPGKVTGRDGKQILVKHGGAVIRVHSFRMQECGSVENKSVSESIPAERNAAGTSEQNNDYDDDEDWEDNPVVERPQTIQGENSDSITNENSTSEPVQGAEDGNEVNDSYIEPSSTMKAP